jgi:hypothetical protein
MKNIAKDMTMDELKELLRAFAKDYSLCPTLEEARKIKSLATPYLNEVNKRLVEKWMKHGGDFFSNRPTKLSFNYFSR